MVILISFQSANYYFFTPCALSISCWMLCAAPWSTRALPRVRRTGTPRRVCGPKSLVWWRTLPYSILSLFSRYEENRTQQNEKSKKRHKKHHSASHRRLHGSPFGASLENTFCHLGKLLLFIKHREGHVSFYFPLVPQSEHLFGYILLTSYFTASNDLTLVDFLIDMIFGRKCWARLIFKIVGPTHFRPHYWHRSTP